MSAQEEEQTMGRILWQRLRLAVVVIVNQLLLQNLKT